MARRFFPPMLHSFWTGPVQAEASIPERFKTLSPKAVKPASAPITETKPQMLNPTRHFMDGRNSF